MKGGKGMEKYSFRESDTGSKLFLLIYDIADDSRRRKFAKFVEGFGYRVQESAFECCISVPKYHQIVRLIPGLITAEDSVRLYPMHSAEIQKWDMREAFQKHDVIIC